MAWKPCSSCRGIGIHFGVERVIFLPWNPCSLWRGIRSRDRLSRWIVQLQARVGYYKTLVAVANKHARILWAVLAKGERFDPSCAPARTRMAAGA
jgi:tRNA(Arg) A34 adenosine deaminase TadA